MSYGDEEMRKWKENRMIDGAKKLEAENAQLRQLVECQEKLLACYRLQRHPSDGLLDKIAKLKAELEG